MQGVKKAWHKVNGYFQSLDAMGAVPEISVGKSSSYKTRLGALLSIACLAVVCVSIYTNISKVFDRNSPAVLCGREFDIDDYKYDILNEDLIPVIAFYSKATYSMLMGNEVVKFATLKADYWYSYYDYAKRQVMQDVVNLSVKPCLQIYNKDPYSWLFNDPIFANQIPAQFCLEIPTSLTSMNIFGSRMSASISALRIHAYPCSLADTTQCKPLADFEFASFIFINKQKFTRFSDFNSPIKTTTRIKEEINLNPNSRYVFFMYAKRTKITDERNWLQPSQDEPFQFIEIDKEEVNNSYRTPTITCTELQINSGQCMSFFTAEYRSSGIEDTCTRTYTEILSAVSDVGGIKELLFMMAGLLYVYYNDFFYEKYLRRTFYPEDEINAYIFGADYQNNLCFIDKEPLKKESGKTTYNGLC